MNKIIQGDCLEIIKGIPDNSVDCIITSPPYNKGYWSKNRNINNGFKSLNHKNSTTIKTKSRRITYGDFDDNLTPKDYEKQQRDLLNECIRVIKDSGSIFYNHIDILSQHQTIHPKYVYDFPVKQIIIWNRKNTPKLDKSYFFPINEYIFWIQKTPTSRTKFNRKQSLFNSNIWDISADVKNKFPAPFPEKLAINCILSTTNEGDTILDPFAGSGTVGKVAQELNRNYILIEREPEYIKIIKERVSNNKGHKSE